MLEYGYVTSNYGYYRCSKCGQLDICINCYNTGCINLNYIPPKSCKDSHEYI